MIRKLSYVVLPFFIICLSGCVELVLIAMVAASTETSVRVMEMNKTMVRNQRGIAFDCSYEYLDYKIDPLAPADTGRKSIFRASISFVRPDSDAGKLGFNVGDEIVKINGEPPLDFRNSIMGAFLNEENKPIEFTMKRKSDQSLYVATLNPL